MISIPDPQFEAADQPARLLGKSRSELFADALQTYLGRRSDEAVSRRPRPTGLAAAGSGRLVVTAVTSNRVLRGLPGNMRELDDRLLLVLAL